MRPGKTTTLRSKTGPSLYLRMELSTSVNGKVRIDMAVAFRFGKMVPATKAIGALIRLTVRVPSGMYMETSTKANG